MIEVDGCARRERSAFAINPADEPSRADSRLDLPISRKHFSAKTSSMPLAPALFDLPDVPRERRRRVVHSASAMTRRLFGHLLPGGLHSSDRSEAIGTFPPLPVQLALPLPGRGKAAALAADPDAEPLFREIRTIEPVLSYKQASLQDIIPGAAAPPGAPRSIAPDDLVLPCGSGLVLYEAQTGCMAFDWMQWSGKGSAGQLGATIDAGVLSKGGRPLRRLTRRRCVVPLMRYSVPVRDGAIWSHRWIEPTDGPVACAAGIWDARRDGPSIFTMVTGVARQSPDGPLILTEDEVLLWLRVPVGDALTIIARRRADIIQSAST